MAWPENAALDALNDAVLTYQKLYGIGAMLRWLEHEASRHRVYREIVTRRRSDSGIASVDDEHEKTLAILDFYADPGNYRTSKRKPVSEVIADGGGRARARIAEIEGRGEENGEGSDV